MQNLQKVTFENVKISSSDNRYSAGAGIDIDTENEISVKTGKGLRFDKTGSIEVQSETEKVSAGAGIKVDKDENNSVISVNSGVGLKIGDDKSLEIDLKSGDNITIDEGGTISAVDTKYTAGNNTIIIDDNNGIKGNYQAGSNVTILDNTISATGITYAAGTNIQISNNIISATDTTYTNATTTVDGLMSSSDKVKLDGVAAKAQVNVQSDWNITSTTSDAYIKNKPGVATTSTLGMVKAGGSNITISTDGVISATGTTYSAGRNIQISDNVISATDTTYTNATTTVDGLMSSPDKVKLDGVAAKAQVNVQSDWNITSATSDAYIKNKPGVATTNTLGMLKAGGSNITISTDGVISATGTTYSAGTNIQISDNVISAIISEDTSISDLKNWIKTTLPKSTNWLSVAYGSGKFVAVSDNSNTAAYSDNGINWTETILPHSCMNIAYGSGKFVAVSDNSNTAAYSDNGINWTETILPHSCMNIAYGNGRFVAVSYDNNIAAYSDNGINWTETWLPVSSSWSSITYGSGRFVAVSGSGYYRDIAAYSDDGITWIKTTLPKLSSWSSVTYGNGRFIAVSYDSDDAAYSDDGINWTNVTILGGNAGWTRIAYGSGKFIVVSSGTISAYSEDNGSTWKEILLPVSTEWYGIAYGNSRFVTVSGGSTNSNTAAYILSTSLQNVISTALIGSYYPETTKQWGYRKYADGWTELWIFEVVTGTTSWEGYTLPFEMKNNYYSVDLVNVGSSTSNFTAKTGNSSKNTASSIYILSSNANTGWNIYIKGLRKNI